MNVRLMKILEKAHSRSPLTRDEVLFMLDFNEYSYESGLIRVVSDALVRKKSGNAGIIIGQLGVDIHPCNAGCKFCSFSEDRASVSVIRADHDMIEKAIRSFTASDDLYGLYLMSMADTDREYLLDAVSFARSVAPATTQIWINAGDNSRSFYKEVRAAGACGAYHVFRIREGLDTRLDPAVRLRSMENIREAGLELYSCVEPVGPEHTNEELADAIMRCVNMEVTQFGAMRRVAIPGTPLGEKGQISNLRMAQLMGIVGLVYASVPSARFFGVHEPCESGYLSGANFVTAEIGANPRDTISDTAKGRGWDIKRCRRLLFECGFTNLLRGDQSRVELDYEYMVKTASLV